MDNNYKMSVLSSIVKVVDQKELSFGFEYIDKPIFLCKSKMKQISYINNTLERIFKISDNTKRTQLIDEFVLLNFMIIETYYSWVFKYTSSTIKELFMDSKGSISL